MVRELLVVCNVQIKIASAATCRRIGFDIDLRAMPCVATSVMSDESVKVNVVITKLFICNE